MTRPATWRDKYKGMEQSWMVLRDQYCELARALGFEGDAWFGDVHEPHDVIVARAKTLAAKPKQKCPWADGDPDCAPEDACPVCGMLGTLDAEDKCIDNLKALS